MSRFLQRVIATVQSPGGSIHPMLGSIYSPTPRPGLPEDAPAVPSSREQGPETTPAAARSGGRRSGDRWSGMDSAGRPQGAAETHAAFDSRLETVDPERRAAEDVGRTAARGPAQSRAPLVNASIDETRDQAASRNEAASRAAATLNSASALRNSISDHGDDAAQTADAAAGGRNTRTTDRYAPAGGIAPVASSVRSRNAAAGEAHDGLHRSRPAAREADEIQIHIGRIEVTAAAPAPARAAAAKPRPSPSLDEFLKRRPGRAG
jgi:hypothetical protein